MQTVLVSGPPPPLLQQRKIKPYPDFVYSSLSRTVTRDGITLKVNIIQMVGTTGWSLEVINDGDAPTIINCLFATDEEADAMFERAVAELGMHCFLRSENIIPFRGRGARHPPDPWAEAADGV